MHSKFSLNKIMIFMSIFHLGCNKPVGIIEYCSYVINVLLYILLSFVMVNNDNNHWSSASKQYVDCR